MMGNGRRFAAVALIACLAAQGCAAGDVQDEGVLLRPGDDLLVVAGEVARAEDVAGDVMMSGGRVEYTGTAGGSYLGAGGDQVVRGRVDGSVRAAGGTVLLDLSVGRNVTAAGGRLEIARGALVEGNAYLAGDSVVVAGVVRGSLYVGARTLVLDGTVEGDVRVEAEHLRVGRSARVGGDVRYRIGAQGDATFDPGATLEGESVALDPRDEIGPPRLALSAVRALAFVFFGGVLIALFPGVAAGALGEARGRPGLALGGGLGAFIGVPVAAAVFGLTLVGIPIALLLLSAFAALVYAAPLVGALWLGERVVPPTEHDGPRWRVVKPFLLAGPVVAVAILLPWIGVLVRVVLGLLGLGAFTLRLASFVRRPAGGPTR